MSKQDMLKMQNNVLRVNIHCDGCKQKVKKTLQKIEGVYKVSIDVDQGKVTVAGNVDGETLIRKLEKSGKHAEFWGPQKNSNIIDNQFKNMQIDDLKGQKGNKSQKGGGKDHQQKGGQPPSHQPMMPQKGGEQLSHQPMMLPQKGGQQPSQQQMMMMLQHMKDLKELKGQQNSGQQPSQQQMMMMMQQMKDSKGPPKDHKSVKFNMDENESDDFEDDDDFDSEFDEEDDYDDDDHHHAPVDKKMQAKKMNGHGNMGGGGGNGKNVPDKMMKDHGKMMKDHGNNDVSKNNGKKGKKGGGGMAGMLKQLTGIGGKKDVKEGKGGKNKNGVNPDETGKKGGGEKPGKGKGEKNEGFDWKGSESMGKNAFAGNDGGFMMNNMSHGLQGNNMNKKTDGSGGMGPMEQMGNHPMEQMRNFSAVQGFPAGGGGGMNHAGGYPQGMAQGPPQVNPYNQQQYMAQMMMNQQQRGYGGPDMYQPIYAHPHPSSMYGTPVAPPSQNFSHMFSDENTDSCSVM